MSVEHKNAAIGKRHAPHNWAYADETARLAGAGYVAGDVGKIAWQQDNDTYWILTDDSPIVWAEVGTDAIAVGFDATGLDNTTATEVQTAIEELDAAITSAAGTGPVSSVFGRTGAVVAAASDYDANQVDFTPSGSIAATDVQAAIAELDTEKQPLDAELTAIAGLTSAADKLPYFTGSGTAALTDLSAFARTILDDANAAAARTTLGVDAAGSGGAVSSVFSRTGAVVAATSDYDANQIDFTPAGSIAATDVQAAIEELDAEKQPLDGELTALAGLTSAADKLPYFTGAGTAGLADFTAAGRAILDDADATAQRTTLGLTIGTNVQAYDAELAALAGLTSAADKLPYFTGSGTAGLADFTSAGRALVDDADAAAQRTTLNVADSTINIVLDGGGSTLTTGVKIDFIVDFNCTIISNTLLADQSGSIVIDLWKDTYANYPPTVADTITASAKPTISSATKSQDTTLTGWGTSITAGNTIRVNIDSVTTLTRCLLSLKVRRS